MVEWLALGGAPVAGVAASTQLGQVPAFGQLPGQPLGSGPMLTEPTGEQRQGFDLIGAPIPLILK
jgi:hypothetical protein